MYINEVAINVVCEFEFYPYIIYDDNKTLWQLEHFKNRKLRPLKQLTFNPQRNAYRINSLWVSRNRLLKLKIDKKFKIVLIKGVECPF